MKKIYLLCLFSVLATLLSADEDCIQALNEAKQAYNSGNYAKAKSLYDYVASECGANYGNASSWSNTCQEAMNPRLTTSKTSISCSANGTTEYITVSSNRNWEIEFPSGAMYSVSRYGNTLTVSINANTSTTSRTDFFNVKTTDGSKVQRISLSQSSKSSSSSSSSYATINNAWIDHNVYENGQKGMKIHVKFDAYHVQNHKVGVCAHFKYAEGEKLKDNNGSYADSGGYVAHSDNAIAQYENTTWNDFTLFFPTSELHMASGCKNLSLSVDIGIYDWTTSTWLTSTSKTITFTFSN